MFSFERGKIGVGPWMKYLYRAKKIYMNPTQYFLFPFLQSTQDGVQLLVSTDRESFKSAKFSEKGAQVCLSSHTKY